MCLLFGDVEVLTEWYVGHHSFGIVIVMKVAFVEVGIVLRV